MNLKARTKKEKVDSYFFSQQSPFSRKRTINLKTVKIAAATLVVVMLVILLLTGNGANLPSKGAEMKSGAETSSVNRNTSEAVSRANLTQAAYISSGYELPLGGKARLSASPQRQYTSSQIVRREDRNLGGNSSLSLATTIPAKLINTVLSSDAVSPVIAEITDDALDTSSSLVVPSGTRVVGQASYDDVTRRLQVRFHALVFADGEERSFSGLALLGDGSAGLEGEYHSQKITKEAGRFLGTFVGGFAEGMKDRQMTPSGQPLEKGSVKNGILNGLSSSAFGEAQSTAQDLEQTKPYLEVPAGTKFLIYLDKEFSP